jgi:putative flippase GtrA
MQFILYCFCGGMGVSTHYGVFYLALHLGLWYQYANVLGYLAGTLMSFFLNRVITFGMRDQVLKRLSIFLAVAALGYLASATLLWLLVEITHIPAKIALLITLPIVVVLQYSLNRKITFNAAPVTN